jgi:hypothetical protein
MKFKINNKTQHLRTTWSDVLLSDVVSIAKLEPEKVTVNDALENVSLHLNADTREYIVNVVSILSNVDLSIIGQLNEVYLVVLFDEVKHIIASIYDIQQCSYEPLGMASYKHKGVTYHIPKTLSVDGDVLLAYNEPAKNITEAANLMQAFSTLKEHGFSNMHFVCALWLKPEPEHYDDENVITRAEQMKDLPMAVVWEVFFCIYTCFFSLVNDSLYSTVKRNLTIRERLEIIMTGYWQRFKTDLLRAWNKPKEYLSGKFAKSWTI